MRSRNESVVFFEQLIDLGHTLPWLEAYGERGASQPGVFQLVLAAIARVLRERPNLNRFVSGRRIYQRNGVWLSFAAKRSMNDGADLSVIKREFPASEDFESMLTDLGGNIRAVRRGARNRSDSEMDWALKLPHAALDAGVRALWTLDRFNLLPASMIAADPMYCSAFLANLGSLKMDAAFHHLYEHGNCPLFVTVGAIAERPMVVNGKVEARPSLQIRYSYDERVEDGLYCSKALKLVEGWLTHPETLFADAPHSEPTVAASDSVR
jgi:hypothetical protein